VIEQLKLYNEPETEEDDSSRNSDSEEDLFGFSVEREMRSPHHTANSLELEIEAYLNIVRDTSAKRPPSSDFWRANAHKHPSLASLFKLICAIPATSASPERMFSQLTLHSSGHKGNSNAETIRRKS